MMAILVLLFSEKRKDTWGQADDGAIKGTKDAAILMRRAIEENKVIKKGNVWGIFFLTFICTSTKNQQSAI